MMLLDDADDSDSSSISHPSHSFSNLKGASSENKNRGATFVKAAELDRNQVTNSSESVDPKLFKNLKVQSELLHSSFFPTQDSWVKEFTSHGSKSCSSKWGACEGSNHKLFCETSSHQISEKSHSCTSTKHDGCSPSLFSSPDCCSTSSSKEKVTPKSSCDTSRMSDHVQSTVNTSLKFKNFRSHYQKKIQQFHSSVLLRTGVCSQNTKCPPSTQKPVQFIQENVLKSPFIDILHSLPSNYCEPVAATKEAVGASSLKHSKEPSLAENKEEDPSTVSEAQSKHAQRRVIRDKDFFVWFSPRSCNKKRAHFDEGIKAAEESIGDHVQSTVNTSLKFKNFRSHYQKKIQQFHSSVLLRTGVCSQNIKCPPSTQKPVQFIQENVLKSPFIDNLHSLPSNYFEPVAATKEAVGASSLKHSKEPSLAENKEEDPSTVSEAKSKHAQRRVIRGKHFFFWFVPRSCHRKRAHFDEGIKAAEESIGERSFRPSSVSTSKETAIIASRKFADLSRENCTKASNAGESNVPPARFGACSEIPPKKSKSRVEIEPTHPKNSSSELEKSKNTHSISLKNDPPSTRLEPKSSSDSCEIPFITIKKPGPENQITNLRTITSLFIVDLLRLTPTSRTNYFLFHGHVVHLVDVFGVITDADQIGMNKMRYQVDDGSGTLDCIHETSKLEASLKSLKELLDRSEGDETCSNLSSTINESINESNLEYEEVLESFRTCMKDSFNKSVEEHEYKVGDTAYANGYLYDFLGVRNMYIYNIRKVTNLSEEADRLLQMASFYRRIYPKTIPGFKPLQ